MPTARPPFAPVETPEPDLPTNNKTCAQLETPEHWCDVEIQNAETAATGPRRPDNSLRRYRRLVSSQPMANKRQDDEDSRAARCFHRRSIEKNMPCRPLAVLLTLGPRNSAPAKSKSQPGHD